MFRKKNSTSDWNEQFFKRIFFLNISFVFDTFLVATFVISTCNQIKFACDIQNFKFNNFFLLFRFIIDENV